MSIIQGSHHYIILSVLHYPQMLSIIYTIYIHLLIIMDIQNLSKNPKVIMQDIYICIYPYIIHDKSTNIRSKHPRDLPSLPATVFPQQVQRGQSATRERQADTDPHFKQVDQLYVILYIIILKENIFFFKQCPIRLYSYSICSKIIVSIHYTQHAT